MTAALAAARAGAERARAELTWDASARAHLALYESLQLGGQLGVRVAEIVGFVARVAGCVRA